MSSFVDYYHKNIANQIRKYRIEKGLTQEQVSELLLKNIKYIGHIERCERTISNKVLINLLEIWQIQPEEFYKFESVYNFEENNKFVNSI